MRAIVIDEFGGPEVLQLKEVPSPEPGAGQVRVNVKATAVAHTKDIATRTGRHPFSREMKLPHILGGEHAGIIDAVGEGVDEALLDARVGVSSHLPCGECVPCRAGRDEGCRNERILGIHRDGAYAEQCTVPVGNVAVSPDDLPYAAVAAMAANGPVGTAQLDAGGVTEGTSVLVPGATGALGEVLVGLAARRGAQVIGLTRDPAAHERIAELGAAAVIDTNDPDLSLHLMDITGGLDVVIDNVAVGELFSRYMPTLVTTGRVIISGALAFDPLPLDARMLYVRSQAIIGVRTGNLEKIAEFWREVNGGYRLPAELVTRFPLERVAEAHIAMTDGKLTGPVVIENQTDGSGADGTT